MILKIRRRSTFRSGLIRLTKDRIFPFRPATPRMSRRDRAELLGEVDSRQKDLDENRDQLSAEEVETEQGIIDQMKRNAGY